MQRMLVVAAMLGALAVPSAASGGGWATVGLSPSTPPDGSGAGDTWVTTVTVLQHGRTPLEDVTPILTITNEETGEKHRFPGRPTDEAGVYRVRVAFPAKGTWDISVYDGFAEYGGARTHTFAPVTVGPASGPPASRSTDAAPKTAPAAGRARSGSLPLSVLALTLVAGALAATALAVVRRSRRKAPEAA